MTTSSLDEHHMVEQILNGNERCLRTFYQTFHRPLASYIRKKIAHQQDMEEILQDTLLGAIEGFRDFSFRCSIFTYLCSIANHKVIDFYRKKRIKQVVLSRFSGFEPILSTFLTPEDMLSEELLRKKMGETFKTLTPQYEQILKLKYIYGYSVSEISRKLSISFKSAESQLFRARRSFVANFSL